MPNSKIISVNITFRNMEATDALRAYASEKISNALRKFLHQDAEISVVLRVEKRRQIAEVTFNADGSAFKNSEESDDMYKSIDMLVDSLGNQLRRHKEKLTAHH